MKSLLRKWLHYFLLALALPRIVHLQDLCTSENNLVKGILQTTCSHQGLKSVPSNSIPKITGILLLNFNHFQTISTALFQDFPELVDLDLSNNYLTSLDAMQTLPLQELILSNNSFTELPKLSNLKKLTKLLLAYNAISTLPDEAFHGLGHLKELDLKKNRITDISDQVFKELPNLETLDLSYNCLQSVPQHLISSLEKLEKFYVSGNHLTKLPDKFFEGLDNLAYVYLYDNPWHCTCALEYLKTWVVETSYVIYIINGSLTLNMPESVVCISPSKMKNVPVQDFSTDYCRPLFNGDSFHLIEELPPKFISVTATVTQTTSHSITTAKTHSTSYPITTIETHPTSHPKPTIETYPTSHPTTTIETYPTSHPTTTIETHPTSHPTTTIETHPTSHPTTTIETHPTSHPTTTIETHPTSHPITTIETHPTTHPITTIESHPTSHHATTIESHPTSHPATTLESHLTSHLVTPEKVKKTTSHVLTSLRTQSTINSITTTEKLISQKMDSLWKTSQEPAFSIHIISGSATMKMLSETTLAREIKGNISILATRSLQHGTFKDIVVKHCCLLHFILSLLSLLTLLLEMLTLLSWLGWAYWKYYRPTKRLLRRQPNIWLVRYSLLRNKELPVKAPGQVFHNTRPLFSSFKGPSGAQSNIKSQFTYSLDMGAEILGTRVRKYSSNTV
ncbi:platelet glycoprotein Ib alpha chain [Rhinatrema bivittatum]|uniref:platelet glycoprotein Ib alpha chain n=1 Tax=Rhinatrema bivittatum TaxID=194408 RepID=UPI00112E8FA7|nr:platelet glycoprotein Ib alpha chain [Rhinatrema bivittatum]